ncbi:hypothetical protein DXG01_002641 [Tephrocybe rancida]|nr:hypothetical protein DXG01_002641 [Tephrocybe rancida]
MHFMGDVLQNLAKFAGRPLYKQYIRSLGPSYHPSWVSISYDTYLVDLNYAAGYWKTQLENVGVQKSDVVGLWITGSLYADLVHLYAIIRAGFVPQVFHLGMLTQGSSMIDDLLRLSSGKVLVYDPYFTKHLQGISVPTCVIPELSTTRMPGTIPHWPLDDLPLVDDEDVAMIFHTSGTTSGRPKPVPQTHRWLKCQSQVNWPGAWQGLGDHTTQKCFNNLGSFGNVGSATGQCIIQTSRPDFDATELLAMVQEGLNNILLYANWLSKLLDVARSEDNVLRALRSVHQIAYTGEALNPEDMRWALEKKIPLTKPETLPSMRLIDGMSCEFLPRGSDGNEGQDDHGELFDFFVPAEAGNCPHSRVRNRPNGHVTGDLFEETSAGYYIFQPSPLSHTIVEDSDALKHQLLKRMEKFNAGRFTHERIDSPLRVVVVATGSLPRTKEKGNIRRMAVEEAHADKLAEIYSQL